MRAYSTSYWFCQKKTPLRVFGDALRPFDTATKVVRSKVLSQCTPPKLARGEGAEQLFYPKTDRMTSSTKGTV